LPFGLEAQVLNDMCSFLLSNLTKMTYSTMCQIEHLVKMYFKMKILIKMTFDLIKSDKGYLYYLGTLWVSLGLGVNPSSVRLRKLVNL
jgi:hypothetical protein